MSPTEPHDRDRQGRTGSRPSTPAPYGTAVGTGEVVSTPFAMSQTSTIGQEKGKARDEGRRASAIFAPTPRRHGDVGLMNIEPEDKLSSGEENSAVGWSNVQSHFSMLWKRKGIYKAKRQKWIQEKAYAVVNDHSRILKLRFRQEEFDSLLMTAADSIADQYLEAAQNKISSRTSTLLMDSYADTARIVMAEAITVESIHDEMMDHDPRGVHFDRMLDREDTVTPKGTTIRPPVDNNKSDDWNKRYELTMRQEGEMKLFGSTRIPEQGILFDKQNAPVDEWKYPVDGKRVRGQQAKLEQDPQSSRRSTSPPPVLSKDGNTEGKVYKNEGTHLTFAPPTNTGFVNY